MAQFTVYDIKGDKSGSIKLSDKIFNIEINDNLLTQATISQLSNIRQPNSHTKTRAEVRGGGRKPWRQKGTGRARAGSSRSPLWIGGGITFGPRNNKNYKLSLNKKMRQKAFLMALSSKAKLNQVIILKKISLELPKTKELATILSKLPSLNHTILVITNESDPKLEVAASNIPYVKLVTFHNLNTLDILKNDYLLFTEDSIQSLAKKYDPEATFIENEDIPKAKITKQKTTKDKK